MKNFAFSFFTLFATTSLLISTASCSDRRRDVDPIVKSAEATPAPAASQAPAPAPVASAALPAATPVMADVFTSVSNTLENIPRSQASSLSALADKLNQNIDASLEAWKAGGGNSTTMTESKLSLARTDFAQKVRALSLAGEDTWKNAKLEAVSSLESVRVAYGKLIAGKGEE